MISNHLMINIPIPVDSYIHSINHDNIMEGDELNMLTSHLDYIPAYNEVAYVQRITSVKLMENDELKELVTTTISNALLFLLVFGMAATVKSMKEQLSNYKALCCGVFLQFIILPLLGFITIKAFDLPDVYGITLLVVVSSPGGSYSNWWCSLFNAELALSIAMTTISTTLSIAFLPLNLFLYSKAAYGRSDAVQQIDYLSLFISIAIIITAVALGNNNSHQVVSCSNLS